MIWTVLIAGASAAGVALIGGLLTDTGPWYRALRKPAWQPPDWLFAPAWTVIFALIAWAGVLSWQNAMETRTRMEILALFALNGALNIAWSWLFFTKRRPDWALVEVMLLWLSIVGLIVTLAPISGRAAWALLPYLLWVSFASYLNLTIVRLNGCSE